MAFLDQALFYLILDAWHRMNFCSLRAFPQQSFTVQAPGSTLLCVTASKPQVPIKPGRLSPDNKTLNNQKRIEGQPGKRLLKKNNLHYPSLPCHCSVSSVNCVDNEVDDDDDNDNDVDDYVDKVGVLTLSVITWRDIAALNCYWIKNQSSFGIGIFFNVFDSSVDAQLQSHASFSHGK